MLLMGFSFLVGRWACPSLILGSRKFLQLQVSAADCMKLVTGAEIRPLREKSPANGPTLIKAVRPVPQAANTMLP